MTSEKSAAAGRRIADRLSDESLRANTGRDWSGWFAVLDAAGATGLGHTATARLLVDEHGVGGWYAQSITVGYEQERGLREVGQTCDGDYQASGNKTVNASAARVVDAFVDPSVRQRWLPARQFGTLSVRTHRPGKSLTADFTDAAGGTGRVSVYLTVKSPDKTQISLSHTKLPDAEAVVACKALWKERLGALKTLLEAG